MELTKTPKARTQLFSTLSSGRTLLSHSVEASPLLIKRPLWLATKITLSWLAISLLLGTLLAWFFADDWQKTALPKTQEPIYAVIAPPPVALASCEEAVRDILREEKIHFATGSATVSNKGMLTLDKVIAELKECSHAVLTIEGHTDNTGSASFNKKLSLQRANAVAKVLQNANLEGFTFETQGLGADEPIAPNDTEEGRYQNRRIEFYLSEGVYDL